MLRFLIFLLEATSAYRSLIATACLSATVSTCGCVLLGVIACGFSIKRLLRCNCFFLPSLYYSNIVPSRRACASDVKFLENWLFLVCKWLVFCSHVSKYVKMISLFTALIILGPVCNVRRIVACLCLSVALV